jgi:hypothetical protein
VAARPDTANTIARAVAFDITPAMLASAGAIHRASAIHPAVDTVSADTDAGLNADTARAHADAGSDADTSGTDANARHVAHTGGAPAIVRLPDTALRRAVRVTVNSGFSRRRNQHNAERSGDNQTNHDLAPISKNLCSISRMDVVMPTVLHNE